MFSAWPEEKRWLGRVWGVLAGARRQAGERWSAGARWEEKRGREREYEDRHRRAAALVDGEGCSLGGGGSLGGMRGARARERPGHAKE